MFWHFVVWEKCTHLPEDLATFVVMVGEWSSRNLRNLCQCHIPENNHIYEYSCPLGCDAVLIKLEGLGISEPLKMKIPPSFKMLGNANPVTQCHNPVDMDLQVNCSGNIKCHTVVCTVTATRMSDRTCKKMCLNLMTTIIMFLSICCLLFLSSLTCGVLFFTFSLP